MRDPTAFLGEEYGQLVTSATDWKLRVARRAEHAVVRDRRQEGPDVLLEQLPRPLEPPEAQGGRDPRRSGPTASGQGRCVPSRATWTSTSSSTRRLARFKRAEASLVYQSGFATNAGLIPQLVGEGDVVVSDELNHGSIIDGVRLSRAERARLQARGPRPT